MKMKSELDLDWIKDNPDYLDMIMDLAEYEESLSPEDDDRILDNYNEENDTDYKVKWVNTDTPYDPSRLYQLERRGFLDRVFDSRSKTMYSISDRDYIVDKVDQIYNQYQEGMRTVIHDFPTEEELKDKEIFDDVVGYEDIKFIMRRSMASNDIVNILMSGPPGSAKTVFLMCINKLSDSVYISGKPTTGPGFMDKMFDEEPRYMAIDELDQMDNSDQEILSEYTETGMVVETKGNGKTREMRTNTKTFAACNDTGDILDNIENRFVDLHFEPYTHEEFIEVCKHILPKNENKSEEESVKIAEAVWDLDGFGNVRKAIQASRLSKGDPEKVLSVLDDYSESGLGSLS